MLYQVENWHMVRDKITKSLGINLLKMRFGVDDFYILGTKMIELPNFEDLSDEELYDKLKNLKAMSGTLYVITHICYKDGFGPFVLEADKLSGLVKNYVSIFSENFFDTNAIIISINEKTVWMFHHSGFLGLFNYN